MNMQGTKTPTVGNITKSRVTFANESFDFEVSRLRDLIGGSNEMTARKESSELCSCRNYCEFVVGGRPNKQVNNTDFKMKVLTILSEISINGSVGTMNSSDVTPRNDSGTVQQFEFLIMFECRK